MGRPRGPYLRGLRRARAERDLTLVQLAERTGRSRDTINQLENLHRGADERTIYALMRALGMSREELIDPDAVAESGRNNATGAIPAQGEPDAGAHPSA